jgi:uncharacterized phiE125 gp8 family phage protein
MQLLPVVAPDGLPLTLEQVRERIGAGDGETDAALTALLLAVLSMIDGPDGELGRAIQPQTWDMVLDDWPDGSFVIPLPPLQEVVSVSYADRAGTAQVLATEVYTVRPGVPSRILPVNCAAWPRGRCGAGPVTVRFRAGYESGKVPEAILTAIVLQVAHMRALTERNLFLQRERVDGVGQQDFAVTDAAMAGLTSAAKGLLKGYKVFL